MQRNYEFIMANIGTNGHVSDSGVIENTIFMKKLLQNKLNVPAVEPVIQGQPPLNYVFLGDVSIKTRFLKTLQSTGIGFSIIVL